VDENADKLDHLESGQILLPPEKRLHLRPKSREEIVEVHHRVNASIEKSSKTSMTSTNKSDAPPGLKRHDTMVKNMEEGEMAKLLLQDKED